MLIRSLNKIGANIIVHMISTQVVNLKLAKKRKNNNNNKIKKKDEEEDALLMCLENDHSKHIIKSHELLHGIIQSLA